MHVRPCILAFDAATGPASVAVWKDGAIAAYVETTEHTMQSARLVPMIEQALAESRTSYKDFTAITCTIGPGSFTGIRTGLATARGLCLATGLPGLGFTTLETLAFAAQKIHPDTRIFSILKAGKGEHYTQLFDKGSHGTELSAPHLGLLADAAQHIHGSFVTVGNDTIPDVTALHITLPRADVLAEMAATRQEPTSALKPFYIRLPDATLLVKTAGSLL